MESVSRVRGELGEDSVSFAFPYGDRQAVGKRELELMKELMSNHKITHAVTTRFAHIHANHCEFPFALPRIAVDCRDTLERFRLKLRGVDSLIKNKGKQFVTQ